MESDRRRQTGEERQVVSDRKSDWGRKKGGDREVDPDRWSYADGDREVKS